MLCPLQPGFIFVGWLSPTFSMLACIHTYAWTLRGNVPPVRLRGGLVCRAPRRTQGGHAGALPLLPS